VASDKGKPVLLAGYAAPRGSQSPARVSVGERW